MKESKGKPKRVSPKTNASQPSQKTVSTPTASLTKKK